MRVFQLLWEFLVCLPLCPTYKVDFRGNDGLFRTQSEQLPRGWIPEDLFRREKFIVNPFPLLKLLRSLQEKISSALVNIYDIFAQQ